MGHDAFTGARQGTAFGTVGVAGSNPATPTKPYLATNIWKTAAFNGMKAGLVIRP